MQKLAVVLFNLGGPDSPEAIRPFLFNLFFDPAIIGLPTPLRWALAHYISSKREKTAREIYATLGGKSPLLEETEAQARALEAALTTPTRSVRCILAMRYWKPFTQTAVAEVQDFAPDHIVLLPLYPQFSTTTTGSSLKEWARQAKKAGLSTPTTTLCCWPTEPGWIEAQASAVAARLEHLATQPHPVRVLFTAHGLPEKIIQRGDPYQQQVEHTAAALAAALNRPELDWRVCYQSRVGPQTWIGPDTDAEIERAGAEGRALVVVPIAFVSEHSETLVELDVEYRHLAEQAGVPAYERVPTVSVTPRFIEGLAALVTHAINQEDRLCSQGSGRLCSQDRTGCAWAQR